MGLGESCSPLSPAETQPRARDVRWCFWVEVEEEEKGKKEEVNEEKEEEEERKEMQQKVGCLVFTDQHLGLFSLSADSPWANHNAGTNTVRHAQAHVTMETQQEVTAPLPSFQTRRRAPVWRSWCPVCRRSSCCPSRR